LTATCKHRIRRQKEPGAEERKEMKYASLLVILSLAAFAQDNQQPTTVRPQPFVYGGLDLGDSAAYVGGAGLMEDTKYFIFQGDASYDNDGKSNDNANITHNGHNRRFKSSAYWRFGGGMFIGGGARWSQLSTLAYQKEQWHPTVGIGQDYIVPFFSTRLQVDYTLPWGAEHVSANGCTVPNGQCTNNVSGPEFSIYLPSPAVRGHVFFRATIAIWRAHETVTSTDPVLTRQQVGNTFFVPETQLTMLYRF
jgi:hypothetical protein